MKFNVKPISSSTCKGTYTSKVAVLIITVTTIVLFGINFQFSQTITEEKVVSINKDTRSGIESSSEDDTGKDSTQIHPVFRFESVSTDEVMLKIANEVDLRSDWMRNIIQNELKLQSRLHRKHWELAQIVNIVQKLNLCKPGKKGLAFAVGQERLPSLFAKYGCSIVATDMNENDPTAEAWKRTDQHANDVMSLFYTDIVEEETFKDLVTFRSLDMNHILDPDLIGQFDFVWSTCSIEHVGSILLGQRVVLNSLELLRPGGTAIHTVEFNLSDLENTLDNIWPYVLWRKKDVQQVLDSVQALGYSTYPVSWAAGTEPWDKYVDLPPYVSTEHIKLLLGEYVASSFLMVFTKPLET